MAGALMPFPGTKIIPAGWSDHHRPVAAGGMTADCVIERVTDGPAPFPLPDGWTGRTLVWAGKARIQELKREQAADLAGQPTESRQYLIQLPYDGTLPELHVGERGDIVTSAGTEYIMKQRMTGSELWAHDFIAWENQTQQNP